MLSVVWYSLLLREVRGEGLIENDITDILLIGQYGFDGSLRPGSFSSGSQSPGTVGIPDVLPLPPTR